MGTLVDGRLALVSIIANVKHICRPRHVLPADGLRQPRRPEAEVRANTARGDCRPARQRAAATPAQGLPSTATAAYGLGGARSRECRISGSGDVDPCGCRFRSSTKNGSDLIPRTRMTIPPRVEGGEHMCGNSCACASARMPPRLRGRSHGRSAGCSVSVNVTFSTQSSPSPKTPLTAAGAPPRL